MKQFLSRLTFAQVMIAGCLVGSVVLGALIWQNQQKISRQTELLREEGEVARIVRDIQSLSEEYSTLYKTKGSEGLLRQDRMTEYINTIAADPKVQVGRVTTQVAKQNVGGKTFDNVYTVQPFLNDDAFSRSQIANFLWKLESDSRRVRVTSLQIRALNAAGKTRVEPDEYPSDSWTFNCKVTSRQRIEDDAN